MYTTTGIYKSFCGIQWKLHNQDTLRLDPTPVLISEVHLNYIIYVCILTFVCKDIYSMHCDHVVKALFAVNATVLNVTLLNCVLLIIQKHLSNVVCLALEGAE